MIHYPVFEATDDDVLDLVREHRLLRLVTIGADGAPSVGLHVYCHDGFMFEVHLVRQDPQLADLRAGRPCVIELDETLSTIPHDWIDPGDVSHADQFYRAASFSGDVETTGDAGQLAEHLQKLLVRYEEDAAAGVDVAAPQYAHYLKRLALARFTTREVKSKFKLGQKTSAENVAGMIAGLRARGEALDEKSAQWAERFLARKHTSTGP